MSQVTDEKTGRRLAHACRERLLEAERDLFASHPTVLEERRHSDPAAPEAGYYRAGYVRALRDVLSLIDEGRLPLLK